MPINVYDQLKNWSSNASRIVIAGIGNSLRGDDSIGIKIVQQLQNKLPNSVYLIECETIPENYLHEIEEFKPSHVLLIDAAILNLSPGATQLVFPEQLNNFSTFSTHALPLQLFNIYLKQFTTAKTALLLIQPKNVALGETITAELAKTATQIETLLIELFATL